jgi:TPR repeat protein
MNVKVRTREGIYRYLIFGLLILLFPISMAVTGYSGQCEDAVAAYKRGDYATAHRLFHPLAQQGTSQAQYSLGVMYEKGQGVPQDYSEAANWYRKAAKQNHASAQNNLGLIYDVGKGVPQDYAEAIRWYRKAAEQGDASAEHNLGVMYDNGQGVPQDYPEAVKCYRKAAKQGLLLSQYNLGVKLAKGEGVPQNYVLAHMWFSLAAAQFPTSEAEYRGWTIINEIAVINRDRVASEMTPAQIAEAQQMARKWKPKKEVKQMDVNAR